MKKFIRVIVLVMACVLVFATLASCAKSVDGIKKKAEKAGYEVEVEEYDTPVAGLTATVEIYDEESGKGAEVYFYEDADLAKAAVEAYESLKDLAGAMGEAAESVECKRSGKAVIIGDAEIIKKVW